MSLGGSTCPNGQCWPRYLCTSLGGPYQLLFSFPRGYRLISGIHRVRHSFSPGTHPLWYSSEVSVCHGDNKQERDDGAKFTNHFVFISYIHTHSLGQCHAGLIGTNLPILQESQEGESLSSPSIFWGKPLELTAKRLVMNERGVFLCQWFLMTAVKVIRGWENLRI